MYLKNSLKLLFLTSYAIIDLYKTVQKIKENPKTPRQEGVQKGVKIILERRLEVASRRKWEQRCGQGLCSFQGENKESGFDAVKG